VKNAALDALQTTAVARTAMCQQNVQFRQSSVEVGIFAKREMLRSVKKSRLTMTLIMTVDNRVWMGIFFQNERYSEA